MIFGLIFCIKQWEAYYENCNINRATNVFLRF